jgi:uncharacterized protein (TIGR00288 family)
MSQDREQNIALFLDFDNVALGARDARQRFDINLLLQRILEKGKIIVKKAYADWHYYKEYMGPLHEAAIELIEIPMPRISGKNSADIRLVVDAMDLSYSKDHIDIFVIISGDSDFSPLVSKLRENNKRVIGVGVKNSSSKLLINNCDEFIFYDDIYKNAVGNVSKSVAHVPNDKRELFDFLVKTAQNLLAESRGVLYSSLIKDTMTRKQPDFNERAYGYSTFGDLLDDARKMGLLVVERDARAGGTWVVHGLGKEKQEEGNAPATAGAEPQEQRAPGTGTSRSSRRRRSRSQSRTNADRPGEGSAQPNDPAAKENPQPGKAVASPGTVPEIAPPKNVVARKARAKKVTTKKVTTKKAVTRKVATKKTVSKKPVTKKAPVKKVATKKVVARKTATKKTATKKTTTKKATKRAGTKENKE